jgi:hypothetical protein
MFQIDQVLGLVFQLLHFRIMPSFSPSGFLGNNTQVIQQETWWKGAHKYNNNYAGILFICGT